MSLLLFLGGTANKSTWREDLIPLLEYEEIAYFNPVVPNWNDEAFERELFIKSLPTTVELYVITKEMRGPYSVAEAVESSNKKPDKTIFLFIKDGFDEHQIKSLEAVQKLVLDNGAYVASSLYEIPYIFKGICLGVSRDTLNSKLASRRKIITLNRKIANLDEDLRIGKEDLSYDEVFKLSGITSLLETLFLEPSDLSKEYQKIFYNSLKKYISNPLFKDTDLNDPADLRFLRESDDFKEYLESTLDKIKDKLISRLSRVEKYLNSFPSEKEIAVKDIITDTRLDRVSLMFILHELKENKKIYDFNGRTVTLN